MQYVLSVCSTYLWHMQYIPLAYSTSAETVTSRTRSTAPNISKALTDSLSQLFNSCPAQWALPTPVLPNGLCLGSIVSQTTARLPSPLQSAGMPE